MAGVLGGCLRVFCAAAMIPLALLAAALLETPKVTEVPMPEEGWKAAADRGAAEEPPAAVEVTKGDDAVPMGSGSMFDRIASVYDVANKWMSLGLDQRWRKALVQDCLSLQAGDRVLDLATGTADVSILVGTRLQELGGEASAVLGLDPSSEMLRRGVSKVEQKGLAPLVRLVKGDAQDMTEVRGIDAEGTLSAPESVLADGSIDKISMSFGIRNVPDRQRALVEMRRVLKGAPSNRVCILEFAIPDGSTFLSKTARGFINNVVPFIGKVATMGGGGGEYQYFQRSILKFPQPLDFAAAMGAAGLPVRRITSYVFGAVHLYEAAPQ